MNAPIDRGPWMQTYSGLAFYLLDPRPEEVRLRDIAHALALSNRFLGHTFVPYPVAQHCVVGSYLVPPEHAFEFLMHDSGEAYYGDMSAPFKMALRALGGDTAVRQIVVGVDGAIEKRFGVRIVSKIEAVKWIDLTMLATEARDLMGPPPLPWARLPDPAAQQLEPWGWEQAEAKFVERFLELGGGHKA